MTDREMTKDEKSAIGHYVVLSYDILDFIDGIREESSNEVLICLYKMLIHPTDSSNEEINKLGEGPVFRELLKRGIDPHLSQRGVQ